MTSHFHDNHLLSLETVKDTVQGEEPDKRQRIGSAQGSELKRRRTVPQYQPFKVLDSLPIVSPIQDTIQTEPLAGKSSIKPGEQLKYCLDFLVGSGNQVKSDLTFVASAVPMIENTMSIGSLAQSDSETVQLNQVFSCGDLILINYCKLPKKVDQQLTQQG